MKKLSVFIFTVLLIVVFTTTGLAASFIDVPTSHWAYHAVNKLVADGLIEGYGNGTFSGDKTMSRYEFAIMTAKAIDHYDRANDDQKKLIDKLSAEFATELNRMGVRLTKVETKTNTWIVGGDMRFRYHTDDPQALGTTKLHGSDNFDWRGRVAISGQLNDNLTANARLTTNWSNRFGNTDSSYGSTAYFDIFNVKGTNVLGFDSIEIGRDLNYVIGEGLIAKADATDGVWLNKSLSKAAKFNFWTGNTTSDTNLGTGVGDSGNANQVTVGQITWKLNDQLKFGTGYYWADIAGTSTSTATGRLLASNGAQFSSSRGYDLSTSYQFSGLTLLGEYVGSTLSDAVNMPGNSRGWTVQLSNGKGQSAAKIFYGATPMTNIKIKGDSAWLINYRKVDSGAVPYSLGGYDAMAVAYAGQPYNTFTHGTDNVTGWLLAYEIVPAKNVTLNLVYQNMKVTNHALTPTLAGNHLDTTYVATLGLYF